MLVSQHERTWARCMQQRQWTQRYTALEVLNGLYGLLNATKNEERCDYYMNAFLKTAMAAIVSPKTVAQCSQPYTLSLPSSLLKTNANTDDMMLITNMWKPRLGFCYFFCLYIKTDSTVRSSRYLIIGVTNIIRLSGRNNTDTQGLLLRWNRKR